MLSRKKGLVPNIKDNIILILLIAGAIINDLTVRALTIGNTLYWKPVITSIAMILIVSLFALFLSYRIRNYVYITLSIYFGVLNGLNYIYFKHYNSFISFSLLNQLKQVGEIGDSVTDTFDYNLLLFTVPTLILITIVYKLNKNEFFKKVENKSWKRQFFNQLSLGIVLLSSVSLTLTSTDKSRISKQWNRPYLVEQLGIYSYSMADFIKTISDNNISEYGEEEATDKFKDYIDENKSNKEENDYSNIFEGKDVFVIHYESAQKFAMDLEFGDGEVTPFLNKMASEGLFFDNFYPQHSVGTSSDSEFTFNTSLLPINNGTIFLSHFDREYTTLPKLLKNEGYYTFSMHGNNGDFWNRNTMHKSLGYDRFFSEKDYNIDEIIGLGLSDKSFYKQSIEKIKELKEKEDKPLMGTLITLTNHYPFADVDKYGEFNVGHLEGTDIGNYLKSFHYADNALEEFINSMDEEGLLDNAVIVLYGDHHAKISKSDYEKVYNYDESTESYYSKGDENYYPINAVNKMELKRTPFIIWSKDKELNEVISTPMGMIDALPTIANMLGVYNPYQLGKDIISTEENTVVFSNGDWLNKDSYYVSSSSKLYTFEDIENIEDGENDIDIEDDGNNEDTIDNGDVVDHNDSKDDPNFDLNSLNAKAEELIELSNSIIQYDLIRDFNGLLVEDKKLNQEESIMFIKPNN